MDTVTTTTLGGFCSYLFYHFLDNILHDMAWILFAAYWRGLREIALQGCKRRDHGRMGYGHLANSTWSTAHLQSIMHRRTKRKKKKAEKKIECDKITVSYIAAGLLCLLYFLRGMPTPWLIACGEYSASFFHHFIFHLTVVDVRHFCWDCYICSFFLSALVIWYRFIIPCIGSFFIFFFGNVPVLLRVYNPVSPCRSTRPQESRTTWSFMSMWRGWMGQGFSLDYTISLLVFVGFYSFVCDIMNPWMNRSYYLLHVYIEVYYNGFYCILFNFFEVSQVLWWINRTKQLSSIVYNKASHSERKPSV